MPRRVPPASPWVLVGASLSDRLAVAQDPASTAEHLLVIAPSILEARDPALSELALAVVKHAACPGALASRFAGHPDVTIRRAALTVPGLPRTALDALAQDPDPEVAEQARGLAGPT